LTTIINFPGKCMQMKAYDHCLHNVGFFTEWLIIIDDDEFIFESIGDGNLRNFLNKRNHLQAIGVNWILYGTNYHNEHQQFTIDSYTRRAERQEKFIKSFCKPEYTIKFQDPHFVTVQNPQLYQDPKGNILKPWSTIFTVDSICINHYYIKSYEDWTNKKIRGDAFYENGARPENDPIKLHAKDNDVIDTTFRDRFFHIIKRIYDRII